MAAVTSPTKASPEEKLVDSLIALMETGTTPWRREWDCNGGGHHVNLLSGRRYRGANPILLTLGMHIRGSAFPHRGSKAVHVLRPQVNRRGESVLAEGGGEGLGEGVSQGAEKVWVSYRPVAVFNAADLAGDALAALIEARKAAEGRAIRPEPERLAAAEAVLSSWPVPVSHDGERACYFPAIDRIQLPDRSAFHSAAGLYATWAHEAIHSTGHASRLRRDLSGSMGSRAYAHEELVAELGAVLLGDRLEIGSDACHHAAYLAHWIELLRESPRLLFQVLNEARQAADLIAPELPEARATVAVASPPLSPAAPPRGGAGGRR